MKKFKQITVLAVAVLLLIGGFSLRGILKGGEERIGKKAALEAALADAGLTGVKVTDSSVDLERDLHSAWYEVEFESKGVDYEYSVDAVTGEILSSRTD